MASSYPGSLDSFTNPASTDAMDASAALYHDVQHSLINDAVAAVQGELGLDPAGAQATVKARLTTELSLGGYESSAASIPGPDFWAFPPQYATGTSNFTSQRAYFVRWLCPGSLTATKLWWIQTTLASTVTGAEIGIYTDSGTLLQSASIASAITTTGVKSVTITGQSLTAGTVYLLAIVVDASTPGAGAQRPVGVVNSYWGATTSTIPCYYITGQTALPSSITPSSGTAVNLMHLMGVSAA